MFKVLIFKPEEVMKPITHILFAAAIASSSVAYSAPVVFDTGAPATYTGSNNSSLWIQANEFQVAGETSVTGAGVYMVSQSSSQPDLSGWDGTFEYFVYADAGNTPGTLVANGNATNIVTSSTGVSAGSDGNIWLFDFDFGAAVTLVAGVDYWLGIHTANDYAVRDPLSWANVTSATATAAAEDFRGDGGWTGYSIKHAFYVEGNAVPEPASLALFGIALAGLGATRRRKSV